MMEEIEEGNIGAALVKDMIRLGRDIYISASEKSGAFIMLKREEKLYAGRS